MPDNTRHKSIDFDIVADLYDSYVRASFDVEFWISEALASDGPILELMCGTGRIGLALVEAGAPYTGLDYSVGLLDQFRRKLESRHFEATLLQADARTFSLSQRFSLIFIGFHSLSEVIENQDKLHVLRQVHHHLQPQGRLTFSLQNPAIRAANLNGQQSETQAIRLNDGRQLEFSWQLFSPLSDGVVRGTQFYAIRDEVGELLEKRELPIRFHLVSQTEIESLLDTAGFEVVNLWGDYDRSPLTSTSPFLIYQCVAKP